MNLEVRFQNELWVYFSDLRILRKLVNCARGLPMRSRCFCRSDRRRTYKALFLDREQRSAVMAGLAGLYEIERDP